MSIWKCRICILGRWQTLLCWTAVSVWNSFQGMDLFFLTKETWISHSTSQRSGLEILLSRLFSVTPPQFQRKNNLTYFWLSSNNSTVLRASKEFKLMGRFHYGIVFQGKKVAGWYLKLKHCRVLLMHYPLLPSLYLLWAFCWRDFLTIYCLVLPVLE